MDLSKLTYCYIVVIASLACLGASSKVWVPKPAFIPGPPGNLLEYDLETYWITRDSNISVYGAQLAFHFGDACLKYDNVSYTSKVCHVFIPGCSPYQAAYYAAKAGCVALLIRYPFRGPAGANSKLRWLDKNKWLINGSHIPIYDTRFDSINRNETIFNETVGYSFAFGVRINLTQSRPNPWIQEYDSFRFVLCQGLLLFYIAGAIYIWADTVYHKYDSFKDIFSVKNRDVGTVALMLLFISLIIRWVAMLDPVRSRGLFDYISYNILPTINLTLFLITNALLAFFFIDLVQRTKKLQTKVKRFLSKPIAIVFFIVCFVAAVMSIARGSVHAAYSNDSDLTAAVSIISLAAIAISTVFYSIAGGVLYNHLNKMLKNIPKTRERKISALMILFSGIVMFFHFLPGAICTSKSISCFFYPRRLSILVFTQQYVMTTVNYLQIGIYRFRQKAVSKYSSSSTAYTSKSTNKSNKSTTELDTVNK